MKKRIIVISIIMIILLLLGFYLNFENTTLQVTNYDISDSKIPKEFNNYKIIQISDFHNTTLKKLSSDLLKEIKEQEPNIIVITGDLIDSRKTDVNIAIKFLKEIKDIAPIYYVTGNHEARLSEYKKLKEEMNKLGINVLEKLGSSIPIKFIISSFFCISITSLSNKFIPKSFISFFNVSYSLILDSWLPET